jgi:ferredoxin
MKGYVMKAIIVEKTQLLGLIDELLQQFKIYGPVEKNSLRCYSEVKSSNEINLDFQIKISSKEILLPRCETLFTYKLGKEVRLAESPGEAGPSILFGIPPCEARGLALIEKAFTSGDFQDVYYLRRKRKIVIISKSCEKPGSTCFCTAVGGSPYGKEGVDVSLHDLGDRYLFEAVSEGGEELLHSLHGYRDATQDDFEEAQHNRKASEESIKTQLELSNIEEKLETMFDDSIWDMLHQKCVGCGVCTYLCPTCYCFDIVDESSGFQGQRVRIWDSCQFPLFTLQGSGENPRHSGKERMRQRIMHKFNYYPRNYGGIACVGCGRCVRECPVNLDIREVLKLIYDK